MGVIISCVALTNEAVKKLKSKSSSKQNPAPSGPVSTPSPFEPQSDVTAGLQVEHLATAPPPVGTSTASAPNQISTGDNKGKMASDEDYAAFLDKANQDPNEGVKTQSTKDKVELKAVDHGVEVPSVLKMATKVAFYVSDADEPFVPVALRLGKGKGMPDEDTFAKLVGHPSIEDADVSIMDIGEWDPQGQYKDVVEATREASKGSDVRVYRIQRDGARAEYWVVGIEGGKLVGVKALAIES